MSDTATVPSLTMMILTVFEESLARDRQTDRQTDKVSLLKNKKKRGRRKAIPSRELTWERA